MKPIQILAWIVAVGLCHCTWEKSSEVQTQITTNPTREERTLIYCSEGSPSSMNPQISEDSTSLNVHFNIYDPLMTYQKGTLDLQPSVAQEVSVSKDARVYRVVLKRDVAFHRTSFFQPSRPLNADDVIFSFNRQRMTNHPYHSVGGGRYLYFESLNMGDLIKDIRKVDSHTVEFILTRPDATFLPMLSMEFASILSKEYAEKLQKENNMEQLDTLPIGTGPFAFKSYTKDSMLRLKKHENYHGQPGNIDHLVVLMTPDAHVRTQKMNNEECHIIAEPSPLDYVSFVNNPRFKVMRATGMTTGYLTLNTKKSPFNQVAVRQAIAQALNRDAYIQAVFEKMGVKAQSIVPPALLAQMGVDASWDYTYQPEVAKKRLAELALPEDFTVELWAQPVSRPYNPDGKKMAEMIQADLAKVGIKVNIVSYDWPTYLAKTKSGEHALAQFGWLADIADPDNFLSPLLTCDAAQTGSNRSFWCNKQFSQWVAQAKTVTDIKERAALYEKALSILQDEVPIIPIAHSTLYRVVHKDVKGFEISALGRDQFDGVNL